MCQFQLVKFVENVRLVRGLHLWYIYTYMYVPVIHLKKQMKKLFCVSKHAFECFGISNETNIAKFLFSNY